MGKGGYSSRMVQVKPRPWDIHPIWRGIGCLMMILIPIMAYAGAVLLVKANLQNRWVFVPREFAQTVVLPFAGAVPYLYAYLVVTVILALIGFALLMVIYSIMYRAVGPDQYGPVDAPPLRRESRRHR